MSLTFKPEYDQPKPIHGLGSSLRQVSLVLQPLLFAGETTFFQTIILGYEYPINITWIFQYYLMKISWLSH